MNEKKKLHTAIRPLAMASAALALTFGLAACGSSEPEQPAKSPSEMSDMKDKDMKDTQMKDQDMKDGDKSTMNDDMSTKPMDKDSDMKDGMDDKSGDMKDNSKNNDGN